MGNAPAGEKFLAKNRKAFHLYHVIDRFEAGIVLLGPEVKSIREGKIQLKDSYATIDNGELWLMQCHVSPYAAHTHITLTPISPLRKRKLLIHKKELRKLKGKVEEKGLTMVPLSVYLKRGKVKIEIGICKGKKLFDKRESIKQRELSRDAERAIRDR